MIKKLDIDPFLEILKDIYNWFIIPDNDTYTVENLINKISVLPTPLNKKFLIDGRIKKSFDLFMKSNSDKLYINLIAKAVQLSESHFNRLFKKETGLSFRQFVLHSKLIKSIYAIYQQNNLTETTFIGGFSDQPHLTRTFKKNFGIKPSASIN